MRIEVVGVDTINQQARTYAEYRVFAALTQFADAEKVRRARVVLRPLDRGRGCDSVACSVTVDIGRSGLHSDTSDRSPRLRSDQPRGRTYQNHGGDRTGRRPRSPCEAYLRPCATASCPVRRRVTDGARYSTPAAK